MSNQNDVQSHLKLFLFAVSEEKTYCCAPCFELNRLENLEQKQEKCQIEIPFCSFHFRKTCKKNSEYFSAVKSHMQTNLHKKNVETLKELLRKNLGKPFSTNEELSEYLCNSNSRVKEEKISQHSIYEGLSHITEQKRKAQSSNEEVKFF